MSLLTMSQARPGRHWFRMRGLKAFRLLPALTLLLGATLLVALETPSKPFLDKNSFYLTSAGFRVQLANDAMGKKALHALPPHRFVMHRIGDQVRYFYAEPQHCNCIFIGTPAAYQSYLDMLRQPLQQADDVSPDYRSQANALLNGTPVWMDTLQAEDPQTLADYFRLYY
jgi:hypothetical protein